MKFIAGIFQILEETNWPSPKQRWIDFIAVIEYTAFFTAIIYAFDFGLRFAMDYLLTNINLPF